VRQFSSKKYEAILVAGYGNTGASVVIDLLKECDGFICPDVEFYVAQHHDGVIGLENALVNSWSDFAPDCAIRRFNELIDILARPATRFCYGYNYCELLSPAFKAISNKYISKLINFSHSGHFSFRRAEMSFLSHFLLSLISSMRRIIRKIKKNNNLNTYSFFLDVLLVKLIRRFSGFSTIMACPAENFLNITREYFDELFHALDKNDEADKIVLDQGATAYQPVKTMNYFHAAKTIIIDRDPRDIFISALSSTYLPIKVKNFIMWHKMTREMSVKAALDNTQIFRINYEELIFSYCDSCRRLFSFLGCDNSIHVNKGKYFVPEKSAKSTGKWISSSSLQREISLIEKELSNYLYLGPRRLE